MQSVGPAAALHHAAGELVDDHDLVVLHHVVLVAMVERVTLQGRVQVKHQHDIGRIVEAGTRGEQAPPWSDVLGVLVPFFRQHHRVLSQVHPVVALAVLFFCGASCGMRTLMGA